MKKEPLCPYCGCKMELDATHTLYDCLHCGSKGPDCNDPVEAYEETMRRYEPPVEE